MLHVAKQLSGLLIAGTTFFFACKSSDTAPTASVSLGLNQSARLSTGVMVQVDSIQDSRCPLNAYCIWAGQAKVRLQVSKNQDAKTLQLALGPDPNGSYKNRLDSTTVVLSHEAYKVILKSVTPYPGSANPGQLQKAEVEVTRQ